MEPAECYEYGVCHFLKEFSEVSKWPAESVADYQGDTYWKEFNIQADTTPIDHTQADGTASATPHKVVRDGQVLIIRGDKTYTATGIEVR